MRIPFATQSYKARALPFSAQRCINYFAEAGAPDRTTKAPVICYNAPGIKALGSDALAGAVRGGIMMGGVAYIVAGNTLYSVDSAGATTSLGTINTNSGRVGMAVNNASPQELCIVDGTDGWTYDTGAGLVRITDGDFLGADTVCFIDGYFIFNVPGTSKFFISNINNGQTYTATDFAVKEGSPDNLVAVFANHRQLWLPGELTTEIWFNSGNTDFPFERIGGIFIERGCAAAFSVAAEDNTLFWLGDDLIVYRNNGQVPQRISTHAIEEQIRTYTDVSDAFGFFITISGHKIYHLTFPTGRATFAYDTATGLWHERESRASTGVQERYWRVGAYLRGYDKHIVGDAFVGRLGELDLDTFAEFGDPMQGILTGPPVHFDRKRVVHHLFEVDIESGVGLIAGQGSDPQIWLDWSDDGGSTWSQIKPFASMGKRGERAARLRWARLGAPRERVYRLSVADPVKRSIIAAHLNAEAGAT